MNQTVHLYSIFASVLKAEAIQFAVAKFQALAHTLSMD